MNRLDRLAERAVVVWMVLFVLYFGWEIARG